MITRVTAESIENIEVVRPLDSLEDLALYTDMYPCLGFRRILDGWIVEDIDEFVDLDSQVNYGGWK
jgi:hypothetical protein